MRHSPMANLALLGVLALLVPRAALAGSPLNAPAPATSTVPAFVRVVGYTVGIPDTVAGRFTVVIRDMMNMPIANSHVVLDVSACPDIRIASNQLNPNYIVDCAYQSAGGFTDATGTVVLTILGNSMASATYSGLGCARILADGVVMKSPTVAAFDLDGGGGVTTADLSAWLADLGTHEYRARGDYDGNALLNPSDLSIFLFELGTHRSLLTSAACP